jgi:hypothetical protein
MTTQSTAHPNNDAAPARDWHQVAQEITAERDPKRISALVQELGRLLGKTPALDLKSMDLQRMDLQSNP